MEIRNWKLAFAPIAQSVEQLPLKQMVPGSSPGGGTLNYNSPQDKTLISLVPGFALRVISRRLASPGGGTLLENQLPRRTSSEVFLP